MRERHLLEDDGAEPGATPLSRTTAPTIGTILRVRKIKKNAKIPRSPRSIESDCLANDATGTESSALPLEPSTSMRSCRAPNSRNHKLLTKNCGSSLDRCAAFGAGESVEPGPVKCRSMA